MSEPQVHLTRTDDHGPAIEALVELLGGRVGVAPVLGDLNRRARRARPAGRAVDHALTWDAADRRTPRWWPQGVSSSADASASEEVAGHRVLAVAWYARKVDGDEGRGVRISFLDLGTLRYRHVLLVVPEVDADGALGFSPLRVHAGGIVWFGPHLFVAATARGFLTCRLDDLVRVPDEVASGDPDRLGIENGRVSSYGYRYLLPVAFAHRGGADPGAEKLRYSFFSLDRAAEPPLLIAGEYARGDQSRRLARFALDPVTHLPREDSDGLARPLFVDDHGVAGTQGVAMAGGEQFRTVSHGPVLPGSVVVGAGADVRHHIGATPLGPEDLTWWPSTGLLWSATEHPRRRWIYAMRRDWYDD